jgi:hypothetical protein
MISIYEPEIKNYSSSAISAINSGWISNHGEYISKANNKLQEILKCNILQKEYKKLSKILCNTENVVIQNENRTNNAGRFLNSYKQQIGGIGASLGISLAL